MCFFLELAVQGIRRPLCLSQGVPACGTICHPLPCSLPTPPKNSFLISGLAPSQVRPSPRNEPHHFRNQPFRTGGPPKLPAFCLDKKKILLGVSLEIKGFGSRDVIDLGSIGGGQWSIWDICSESRRTTRSKKSRSPSTLTRRYPGTLCRRFCLEI